MLKTFPWPSQEDVAMASLFHVSRFWQQSEELLLEQIWMIIFWILLERPLENASTRVVPRMKVLRGIFFGQEISVRKFHLKEDQMEQIGCSPKTCILRRRKKYFRPYQQEMYDFTWKCWCHEKKGQGFHPQIFPIGFWLSGWVTPDFNTILVLRGGTLWRPKKTENASACDASLK